MKKIIFLFCFILIAVIAYISIGTYSQPDYDTQVVLEDSPVEEEIYEPVIIKITAVGDIMTHGPQLKAQYDNKEKIYNFENNYIAVKPYIEKADIALCNIETVFAGEEEVFSSYPRFNTPDSLANALSNTGFDIGITANNHCFDREFQGLLRTIEVIRDNNMVPVGTQLDGEKKYIITDIKDVKVGITAYTYETGMYRGMITINGLAVPNEAKDNINTFSYETLEEDLHQMAESVREMKDEGAELIIFYLHWGEEYIKKPNAYQKQIAQKLSESGVDIIFGSHPHVLQPVEIIEQGNGHKTLIFYSMGNFISNQRYEQMGHRYSEDGIIAEVTYEIDTRVNDIKLKEVKGIPTWVYRYYSEGKHVYEIQPLADFLKNNLNKDTQWKVENSLQNTVKIMGEEFLNRETYELIIYRDKRLGIRD